MNQYQIFQVLTLLCMFSQFCHGDPLYCYRCFNIDCHKNDVDCQYVQSFIQDELKSFYHLNGNFRSCPNNTFDWTLMQADTDPCPDENSGRIGTCALGRIQVKTFKKDGKGKPSVSFTHATILGCAKRDLLSRVWTAKQNGKCDFYIQEQETKEGVIHQLAIEHCHDASTMCNQNSFCINWKDSATKKWGEVQHSSSNSKPRTTWNILGYTAVVFAVVVLVALAIQIVWNEWANRKMKSVDISNNIEENS